MDILSIPFHKHINIGRSENAGYIFEINERPEYLNHLGTIHACVQLSLAEAVSGRKTTVHFVPHSGPFARGIHMTLTAKLKKSMSTDELKTALQEFYADKPFIEIVAGTPRIKDVVGSNYAHIGVAVENGVAAVFIAIDNLVKGAAGGAVQWMNRQLGYEETAGLTTPGPVWI